MAFRGLGLAFLLFSAGFVACVSNHEALEKKPTGRGGNGSSGAFAAAGAPSHRGGTGGDGANGGGHADDEPPGESVLTIVNGIVDAPRVALCLAQVAADGSVTPLGSPLTEAPLEYGQSLVVREVDGVDFDTDGLQPVVIAGELTLVAGLDCDAAIRRAREEEARTEGTDSELGQAGAGGDSSGLALPPSAGSGGEGGGEWPAQGGAGGATPRSVRSALRVRGLPAISAGTLNAGRSLLFVANGCMGGATYGGAQAERYCGSGYTPGVPTVSAIVVSLSRQVSTDRVALQAVHASLASAQVEFRSRPAFPNTGAGISIASVLFGQVAPRPASIQNTLFDLGSSRKYQVSLAQQGEVVFSDSWTSVLAIGGLSELKDGEGYALVFNGPEPDAKAVPNLWNSAVITAIPVNPE